MDCSTIDKNSGNAKLAEIESVPVGKVCSEKIPKGDNSPVMFAPKIIQFTNSQLGFGFAEVFKWNHKIVYLALCI